MSMPVFPHSVLYDYACLPSLHIIWLCLSSFTLYYMTMSVFLHVYYMTMSVFLHYVLYDYACLPSLRIIWLWLSSLTLYYMTMSVFPHSVLYDYACLPSLCIIWLRLFTLTVLYDYACLPSLCIIWLCLSSFTLYYITTLVFPHSVLGSLRCQYCLGLSTGRTWAWRCRWVHGRSWETQCNCCWGQWHAPASLLACGRAQPAAGSHVRSMCCYLTLIRDNKLHETSVSHNSMIALKLRVWCVLWDCIPKVCRTHLIINQLHT